MCCSEGRTAGGEEQEKKFFIGTKVASTYGVREENYSFYNFRYSTFGLFSSNFYTLT